MSDWVLFKLVRLFFARNLIVFPFLFLLLSSQHAVAFSTIEAVNLADLEAQKSIALNADLQVLVDGSDLGIESVLALPNEEWQANTEAKRNFGIAMPAHWFRLALRLDENPSEQFYLRIAYPHMDLLQIYFVRDGQVAKSETLGDTLPFSSRPVNFRQFLLPMDDLPRGTTQIYIRAQSPGVMDLPIDVVTYSEFHYQDKLELMWYGAYFGIVVAMFFYNLFIFFLVRDITYFFYLFYVASTAVLQLTLVGLGFQFIWPDQPELNNKMVLHFTAAMPLCAVAFVTQFLGLERNGKSFDRMFSRVLIGCYFALFVASFSAPYALVLKASHGLSFIAISAGIFLGVSGWLKGIKAAKTFTIAWLIYLVFVVIYLLDIQAVIASNYVTKHALEIGAVLELVLLSLAFGHRINEEKQMRIEAQDQALEAQTMLNKDLDELVNERTEQLEQANLRLRELSMKDGLTGIYNRRHFDSQMEIEYQRSFREQSWVSVAMIDVDHFKTLNDAYGHLFGDHCLKHLVEIIAQELRRPPDLLARYGGEEFVVLLPGADDQGGLIVAEKIRKVVEASSLDHEGKPVHLSVSIGVASVIPRYRNGWDELLRVADENLYRAKSEGRNRVVGSALQLRAVK